MTAENPLAKAMALPEGAVFHRFAFQVNPSGYGATFRGKTTNSDDAEFAKNLIDKAVQLEISALAVTNHNDVAGVSAIRSAAIGSGVQVFPGFELYSSDGIHILCIYAQDTDDARLERLLGEFGILNTTPSSDLANMSCVEILRQVKDQGGVTIAAHVTGEKGLLASLSGQSTIRTWQDEELLAIQIPGQVDDLPHETRKIVMNKNPDYRREHPAEKNLAVAVVNAKDVIKPEDLEIPSATCWVKMFEIGIEGLRQAFLDPGSRIRLNPREDDDEHVEFAALAWEGGFLDEAAIHFNPNLNVLVGGRGSGKSTVVESIRSVLGLTAVGDEARKANEGITRNVLKSGTKISLLVRVYRPAMTEYVIERTIPNPPLVRVREGEVSNLSPSDVIPRVEVYGQHEISEISKSPEKLTRLLDRFVERDDSLTRRKRDLQRDLGINRRGLLESRVELRQIEERLAALPGLEETLERFREAGLEERLRDQSLLVREEQVLASIPKRLAPLRELLENMGREMPIDREFLSAKALADLPGKEILAKADIVLAQLSGDTENVAKDLEQAVQRADQEIALVREEWEARKQDIQSDYEKILRELQKSRVDGEEFIRLRRQIEELRPLRERLDLVRRVEKEHANRRRALLADWEDYKAEEFRLLDRASKKVNRKLRENVQVEVTAGGDREPLFEILRSEIGGRLSEAMALLGDLPELSLTQLVEACRAGADMLNKTFGISPAQAERLAKANDEVLMGIEELDLSPTTAIRLNIAPMDEPTEWQALEDLSTGQKATAVLLLLLLESDAPLIVDQPEDDLDNRFITEGVVPRMREEKQHRQFIFSTHNANIPVLGGGTLKRCVNDQAV